MTSPAESVVAALVVDDANDGLAATVERLEAAVGKVQANADTQYRRENEEKRHERNHELLTSYLEARHEITKKSIERARDGAKFVQTASAAIASLYTGLLTLTYSTDGRSLPLRGVYATVFLGLAVAGSTAYLAFLRRGRKVTTYVSGYSPETNGLARADHLTRWVNSSVLRSSWVLRSAVVALAVGVALIPAAFVGDTAKPSSGGVEPPAIPERVPGAIEDEANMLFAQQVENYLESLDVVPEPEPEVEYEHDGPTSVLHGESWLINEQLVGGDKLERNFFWLAFWGFVAVIGLPTLWFMGESLSRFEFWYFNTRLEKKRPDRWVTGANVALAVLAAAIVLAIAFGDAAVRGLVVVGSIVTIAVLIYLFGRTDGRLTAR